MTFFYYYKILNLEQSGFNCERWSDKNLLQNSQKKTL